MPKSYINTYIYTPVFPKPLSALQKENFVVNPVSNSAISLCASSTELTYPKLSACLPSSKRSRFKITALLFLFVPQESWDWQLRMFGYITREFPRIFGYVLQVIKYSISVPLDRGGFDGWNLMLTFVVRCTIRHYAEPFHATLHCLYVRCTIRHYAELFDATLYRLCIRYATRHYPEPFDATLYRLCTVLQMSA